MNLDKRKIFMREEEKCVSDKKTTDKNVADFNGVPEFSLSDKKDFLFPFS